MNVPHFSFCQRSVFLLGINVYHVYMYTLAVTKWRDKWQTEMTSVQMDRLVFQANTAWLFQNKSVPSTLLVHWPSIAFLAEQKMCDAHVPCNRYDLPKYESKKTSALNAWRCFNSYVRILDSRKNDTQTKELMRKFSCGSQMPCSSNSNSSPNWAQCFNRFWIDNPPGGCT